MVRKLFQPAPLSRWQQSVSAGGRYSERYGYIHGYYKAAKALTILALEGDETDKYGLFFETERDKLFFPICFNYRHYIELCLKHLIISLETYHRILTDIGQATQELRESAESKVTNEHSLERLLRWMTKRLESVTDGDVIDASLRETILQFHQIDPDGQTFRYPVRKGGKSTLPEQSLYDLENVRDRMEEVYNYFSGFDTWLDENTQSAFDYLQEVQAENSESGFVL